MRLLKNSTDETADAPLRLRSGGGRGWLATWLLVGSAFTLVATPAAVWAMRPRPNVGSLPRISVPRPTDDRVAPTPGARNPNLVSVHVRSARLDDYVPPQRGPRPVSLTIAAIGARAPIVPVGVEDGSHTGQVPPDVDTVGWYRFGSSPGQPGSAVLLGHVDSRTQGLGAFFGLRELQPGDAVSVSYADGSRSTFRVVARRLYPKSGLPPMLFGRRGRPTLAL